MAAASKTLSILDKLRALTLKYGFITSSSAREGFTLHHYGPCGAGLKHNLINEWTKAVTLAENISLIDVTSASDDPEEIRKAALSYYPHLLRLNNDRLPVGLIYRTNERRDDDEISKTTGDDRFLIDSRFRESYVLYQFVAPFTARRWIDYWERQRIQWWRRFARNPSNFTVSERSGNDSSDTAASAGLNNNNNNNNNGGGGKDIVKIRYDYPWGRDCIETIANYEREPLDEVGLNSTKFHGKAGRKTYLPSVLEIKFNVEHAILVNLCDAFAEKKLKRNLRTVLQLHRRLVHFKVAVAVTYSASSMTEVQEVAGYVTRTLLGAGIVTLNLCNLSSQLTQNVTKCDHMGIPHVLIINEQCLTDGLVQLRNRDTTLEEQVHLTKIVEKLLKYNQA
ncbi:DNA polymerase subunit gamma-2-like [Tubulanus polymorphus]|uniref:DNA polymerase subunit gamma-2-like n=1 Tax=Tubulanus polymorphus TaxID=672921 RepID=UPI003DA6B45B